MKVLIDHLNLQETAYSGQCFRWKELSDGAFLIPHRDNYIVIKPVTEGVEQSGAMENANTLGKGGNETDRGQLFEVSCSEEDWNNVWADYFDLGTDYNHIEKLIMESYDEHLKEAYKLGKGIRILKQDTWEMIVSYLISQNNNITRIKKTIDMFCSRCGYEIDNAENGVVYADTVYRIPGPCDMLPEGIFDDATLGFGYRNIYLKEIYEFVKQKPDFVDKLQTLDYDNAREELLKRKGIGPKVADCISLFGLHHVEAFPIDTHVKQLLNKYYQNGFPFDYFNGVAGIIQQYLFYYELKNK